MTLSEMMKADPMEGRLVHSGLHDSLTVCERCTEVIALTDAVIRQERRYGVKCNVHYCKPCGRLLHIFRDGE